MIKYVVMYQTPSKHMNVVAIYDTLKEAKDHVTANTTLRFDQQTIDGRRHWFLDPIFTRLEITEVHTT